MRLSNKNKASVYHFVMTLLNIFLILGIVPFFIERYKFDVLGYESWLLIVVPLLLMGIFVLRGRQIFEYDSDGEALNFKNRSVMPFTRKEARDEFPKYKLLSYEVVNAMVFKNLYIKIKSKKEYPTVLKYDISYLTNKEIRDLKTSLNKIVKYNREANREG